MQVRYVPQAIPLQTLVPPFVIVMMFVANVIVPTVPSEAIKNAPRTVVRPVTVIVSLFAAEVPFTIRRRFEAGRGSTWEIVFAVHSAISDRDFLPDDP